MTHRDHQAPNLTGAALTYYAAAAGDTVPADGRAVLHVKNTDTSPHDLTIVTPGVLPTGAYPDLVVTVPAGTDKLVGPLPASLFADPVDHVAHLTWSATTGMSFAVIQG